MWLPSDFVGLSEGDPGVAFGPSSQNEAGVLQPLLHRAQERRWPSANPGSASLEWSSSQAVTCPLSTDTIVVFSVDAEVAFVDSSCRFCEWMTMAVL